jgi:hypothetical protein
MSDYIDNIALCYNERQQQEHTWRKTSNSLVLQHPPRVVALVLVDDKLASTLGDTTQMESTQRQLTPNPDPSLDPTSHNVIEPDADEAKKSGEVRAESVQISETNVYNLYTVKYPYTILALIVFAVVVARYGPIRGKPDK